MQKFFVRFFFSLFIFSLTKNCAEYIVAKINSQKNCALNKALQKCAADIFVYLLVERGKALSSAHRAH